MDFLLCNPVMIKFNFEICVSFYQVTKITTWHNNVNFISSFILNTLLRLIEIDVRKQFYFKFTFSLSPLKLINLQKHCIKQLDALKVDLEVKCN